MWTTLFAGLLGLAFGSFLNVFLARFPEGESIVAPRSHCRHCEHTLTWWENLPLLSWLMLRGRCRQCRHWIGLRYPAIELAVGLLWAACWWSFGASLLPQTAETAAPELGLAHSLIQLLAFALLCWLLVALAALDAEYFWLPDVLTIPGIVLGLLFTLQQKWPQDPIGRLPALFHSAWNSILAILTAGGLILFIRLAYWIVRRQEGMGLGDAKLMAMLGAWLGLQGALETFILSVFAGAAVALVWLAVMAARRKTSGWTTMPLPFGTILCACALLEIFSPDWLLGPWLPGF